MDHTDSIRIIHDYKPYKLYMDHTRSRLVVLKLGWGEGTPQKVVSVISNGATSPLEKNNNFPNHIFHPLNDSMVK